MGAESGGLLAGIVCIIFSNTLMHVFRKADWLAAIAVTVALLSDLKILASDRKVELADVTSGPPALLVPAR